MLVASSRSDSPFQRSVQHASGACYGLIAERSMGVALTPVASPRPFRPGNRQTRTLRWSKVRECDGDRLRKSGRLGGGLGEGYSSRFSSTRLGPPFLTVAFRPDVAGLPYFAGMSDLTGLGLGGGAAMSVDGGTAGSSSSLVTVML